MKIERLPSGTYRTLVYLGKDEKGKKKYKSLTHKDKKKLAAMAAAYADLHRDYADAETFGKTADSYINARESILSPSSIRGYKSMAKALKSDYKRFCALSVQNIGQKDVQNIIDSLASAGKSPKTIRNYSGFISSVLAYAGVQAPETRLPAKVKAEYYIPDKRTMSAVLKAVEGHRLEIPVGLAVMGLRRGEICALSLEDLNGTLLHVHRAKVYTADGEIVEKAPKTYESDRYIEIPQRLADKIREQGFITDYTPGALSEAWTAFLKTNKFKHFRFHDCRHFFVSYCHNILKLSDAQIMKLGGWRTSHVMRSVYLQSMESKKAARKVAAAFNKL